LSRKIPDLDHVAIDERNRDPIPFGVDGNVGGRATCVND
jgi:hypothetical protein